MNKFKNLFLDQKIHTDDLGRLIIHDEKILEKINGALITGPEFIVLDAACGNGNCVC
jgi:hypothetical protein